MSPALKLLYVDDDADIREVTQISLALDPSLEVRTAASGAEALDIVAADAWRPQALLLDVMMPDMDGPAVLAAIRERGHGDAPKAIFITARVRPAEIARLMAHGALGVITKPFDPLTLAAEVRRILATG